MKYFPLIFGNILRRSKLRNFLTLLVIALAILLISILSGVFLAFSSGVDMADAKQLITRNKVSMIFPLPLSYLNRIDSVEGVEKVVPMNWFGGVYKEPANFFPRYAAQMEPFLDINPRFKLKPEERQALLADRAGCMVGDVTAKLFNLKVGDPIQLEGDIYPGLWNFTIRAIYTVERVGDDATPLYFHWEYLNEWLKTEMPEAADHPQWYTYQIDNPNNAASIAKTVDGLFANSAAETMTETEAAFQMGFLKMMGDIEMILMAVGTAVFFAMLMVAMNTIMMSARERTTEVGVLKSMGFSSRTMIGLVVAESITIGLIGAIIGTGLTALVEVGLRPALASLVPTFYISPGTQLLGVGVGFLIGFISGLIPAVRASRLHPVTALRAVH